jgi:hypothetical protein
MNLPDGFYEELATFLRGWIKDKAIENGEPAQSQVPGDEGLDQAG